MSSALRAAVSAYMSLICFLLPPIGLFFIIRQWTAHWGEDFWQDQWDLFLSKVGHDQRFLYGVMPSVSSILTHWVVGSFFLMLDLTGWLSKYKVQPGKNQPPAVSKLTAAFKVVLFNQLVIGVPLALLGYELGRRQFENNEIDRKLFMQIPTLGRLLMELMVHFTGREIFFYYSHRLMHHGLFYKRFHKRHHEWTAPIALIAMYCHPLEHIFCNIIPVSVTPALLVSHPLISWTWFMMVTTRTTVTHSGFHLPFAESPEYHDYHHLKSIENFGTMGILDALHGTDETWRKSQSFKRYFNIFGFRSAREIVGEKRTD